MRTLTSYWDRNAWLTTNAIVIAAVLIAKLLNENIGYSNSSGCDSWYFFGVYQDYFHLRAMFLPTAPYQFDRFPAILPWIFLGPRVSAVALTEAKFWTYFLISSGSFSYAAITLFGARIGPLISILFLGCTLFIGSLSTDYVTGAGLAWECALIAASIQAARSERHAPWLILAGMLGAFCVYTHSPMAMFIFSTPLYLFLRPKPTVKYLANSVMLMMVGFFVTTIVLCVASSLLYGNFFFFKNELLTTFRFVIGSQYYARPMPDTLQWFSYDANIPVFLLAAAASLLTLVRLGLRRAIMASPNMAIPALIYLAVFILCFGWEFSGRIILQQNVYAPWMLPSVFLAIASALSLATFANRPLSIVLCMAVALVLVWTAGRANPGIDYWWRYILAAAAVLSLALPFRAWSTALATGCILALLGIDYPTGYGELSWFPRDWNGKALYELAKRAHQFITVHTGNERPRFWIGGDFEGLGDPLMVAVAAPLSFLECSGFPQNYPSLQANGRSWQQTPNLLAAVRNHYISAGQRLFVIAHGHDLVASASHAFHSAGLSVTPLDETEITPGISIAVAYIDKANPDFELIDSVRTKVMAQARSLSLATMTLASQGVSLRPSASGVAFRSAPDPWGYIARMPLLAGCIEDGGWVAVDIRVTQGTVGVGVLNHEGDNVVASALVAASDSVQTIFVRLDSLGTMGDLVVRNLEENSFSEGIVQTVRIAADDGQTPVACDPDPSRTKAFAQGRSLSLETLTLGAAGASLQPSASGVAFRSLPDPWAYIGRMPLDAGCIPGGGWVAADIRVTQGAVGVGVLNRKGDDFLVQRAANNQDGIQTIFLRLDSFAAAGDLILRNWDGVSPSEGLIQAVRIAAEDGQSHAECNRDPARTAALAQSNAAPDLSGTTTNLPLESLQPQNGGNVSTHEGSIVLTTSAQQWAYAASAPLALPERAIGPGVVRARLQVEQGKLGIGVLARDNASPMLAEQAADVTDAPIDVDIELADVADAGSLVLRSWSPNGISVRARIFSIETLLQRAPQRAEPRP